MEEGLPVHEVRIAGPALTTRDAGEEDEEEGRGRSRSRRGGRNTKRHQTLFAHLHTCAKENDSPISPSRAAPPPVANPSVVLRVVSCCETPPPAKAEKTNVGRSSSSSSSRRRRRRRRRMGGPSPNEAVEYSLLSTRTCGDGDCSVGGYPHAS